MNRIAYEPRNIMKDTETTLNENEWKDTGKRWVRNCPECGKEISYCDKYKLKTATLNNTKCESCWRNHRTFTKESEFHKPCPECGEKIFYATKYKLESSIEENWLCRSCSKSGEKHPRFGVIEPEEAKERRTSKLRGKKRSSESKKRYSISKSGENNPWFGTHIPKSEEHRRKIRLSCIESYKKKLEFGKDLCPRHNPFACKIIDEYGFKNGYSFQHALNEGEFYIKELGYWVDGYDKSKNVVIEYYESHHNKTERKIKDEKRMREIIDFLKCKFIIIYENGEIRSV